MKLYHGTDIDLKIGGQLLPFSDNIRNLNAVFAAPDINLAILYGLTRLSKYQNQKIPCFVCDRDKAFVMHEFWNNDIQDFFVYTLDENKFIKTREWEWSLIDNPATIINKERFNIKKLIDSGWKIFHIKTGHSMKEALNVINPESPELSKIINIVEELT